MTTYLSQLMGYQKDNGEDTNHHNNLVDYQLTKPSLNQTSDMFELKKIQRRRLQSARIRKDHFEQSQKDSTGNKQQ